MMKLLILLSLVLPLSAQESEEGSTEESYANITERRENDESSQLGQLEQMTQDDRFAPVLQACKTQKGQDGYSNCLDSEFQKLDDATRANLTRDYLGSEEMENRYDSADLGTVQEQYNDPALEVLKKHLYERLQEALYGQVNQQNKQVKTVDHKLFYELYKSQISKNIILALTSFCYDSDLNSDFVIKKTETASVNERNKKMLAEYNADRTGLAAADKWQACIVAIPDICHKSGDYKSKDFTKDPWDHTQQRACEVTGYLKDLRQNLIRLTEIETQVKEQTTKGVSLQAKNQVIVNTGKGSDSQESIDEMTSITSGEIKEITDGSDYTEAVDSELEEVARCKESANIDDPACRKYVINEEQREQIDQANAEYGARVAAMKNKLASMDEEQIRAYLADEGRSDTEINELLENSGNNIESLRENIAKKYADEKQAIIARMNERLKGRTIAATDDPNATPDNVMTNIENELNARAGEYMQLIHFNNIVSGYLSVGDEGDRNIASTNRELDQSAYADDDSYHEKLQDTTVETLKGATSGDGDSVTLDVEGLNENILKTEAPTDQATD